MAMTRRQFIRIGAASAGGAAVATGLGTRWCGLDADPVLDPKTDGDRVVPLMSQFADGRKTPAMWEQFQSMPTGPLAAIPANAQVLQTRQPLLIEDCATSPLIPAEWIAAFGLRACLIVPMLRQDRVIGVMTLDYCDRPGRLQD